MYVMCESYVWILCTNINVSMLCMLCVYVCYVCLYVCYVCMSAVYVCCLCMYGRVYKGCVMRYVCYVLCARYVCILSMYVTYVISVRYVCM